MSGYTKGAFWFAVLGVAVVVLINLGAVEEGGLFAGQRDADDLRSAGFEAIFDGESFEGWELESWHEGHFTIREGGVIAYDGQTEAKGGQVKDLWTTKAFGDFTFSG